MIWLAIALMVAGFAAILSAHAPGIRRSIAAYRNQDLHRWDGYTDPAWTGPTLRAGWATLGLGALAVMVVLALP